jgi:hypothetical protein
MQHERADTFVFRRSSPMQPQSADRGLLKLGGGSYRGLLYLGFRDEDGKRQGTEPDCA